MDNFGIGNLVLGVLVVGKDLDYVIFVFLMFILYLNYNLVS